jgi:hypothetical protein
MWQSLGAFLVKLVVGVGAYFSIRQGGKTSQKLKGTQDTLKGVRKRDETRRKVRKAGAASARKRMRKRNG